MLNVVDMDLRKFLNLFIFLLDGRDAGIVDYEKEYNVLFNNQIIFGDPLPRASTSK